MNLKVILRQACKYIRDKTHLQLMPSQSVMWAAVEHQCLGTLEMIDDAFFFIRNRFNNNSFAIFIYLFCEMCQSVL